MQERDGAVNRFPDDEPARVCVLYRVQYRVIFQPSRARTVHGCLQRQHPCGDERRRVLGTRHAYHRYAAHRVAHPSMICPLHVPLVDQCPMYAL